MGESARSILRHLYEQGRMTEWQYDKIDRNLKAQPYGEWIEKIGMRVPEDKGVKFCSNCMNRQPRDFVTHKPIESNFCPICGSDNRGGGTE